MRSVFAAALSAIAFLAAPTAFAGPDDV